MVQIELETITKEKKVYPRYLIKRTETIGEVTDVTSWSGTKTKTNKEQVKSEVKSEKIILTVLVQPDKVLQCWMNADVKKGSDPAYDTTSYTNLKKLGLLEDFTNQVKNAIESKITIDLTFVETYFRNKLKGKKITFVPETLVDKETKEEYSTIKTIEGFA